MSSTPTRPADARMLHHARAAAAELMARYHVPGLSVAVTDRERLLYAEGFGHADLAARRRASANTRYLWFSMSKIATATVAMRLADHGLLDLDAPVDTVVPGYRASRGPAGDPPCSTTRRVRPTRFRCVGCSRPTRVRPTSPLSRGGSWLGTRGPDGAAAAGP